MANLVETSTFEAGVYQVETTDPVAGGPPTANTGKGGAGHGAGILNLAAQQVANRTRWLYNFLLAGTYAAGDLLYATGTAALARLPIGAANRVLTSSGSAPRWSDSLTLALITMLGPITVKSTSGAASVAFTGHGGTVIEGPNGIYLVHPGPFRGKVLVAATNSEGVAEFLVDTAATANACTFQGRSGSITWTHTKGSATAFNVYVELGKLYIENTGGGHMAVRFILTEGHRPA